MGKFIVQQSEKNGEFWFDLKAANGEIIGKSEMYESKEGCLDGIDSVKRNANAHQEDQCEAEHPHYDFPKYEIYVGEDKQFYFRLCAANGQNILGSEGYTAKNSCINGILSVGENAPDAPIVEAE